MGDVFESETRVYSLTSVAAPSMYLRYHEDSSCDVIIQDVYVPEFSLAMCTYYCSMAWRGHRNGHGFCGIQNHVDGKSYIFSIWNSQSDSWDSVTPVYMGSVTRTKLGDGKGKTGLKSMLFDLDWKPDSWYTVAVRLWDHQDHTRLGFWIKEKGSKLWAHAITLDFAEHWVDYDLVDSFFEDWGLNGDVTHHVKHRIGMKRNMDGSWSKFKSATFHVNEQYSSKNYSEGFKTGIRTACLFFQKDSSRNDHELQAFSDEMLGSSEQLNSSRMEGMGSSEERDSSLSFGNSLHCPAKNWTPPAAEVFGSCEVTRVSSETRTKWTGNQLRPSSKRGMSLPQNVSCSLHERSRSCEEVNHVPNNRLGSFLTNERLRTPNSFSDRTKEDTGSFEELPYISDKKFWLYDEPERLPKQRHTSSIKLFSLERNQSFQEQDTFGSKEIISPRGTFQQGHGHESQKRFAVFHHHFSLILLSHPVIQFTIESMTRCHLSWNVAEHETPQFKFTIKDGDTVLDSQVDPGARACDVDLSRAPMVTVILEDIFGRESSLTFSTVDSSS